MTDDQCTSENCRCKREEGPGYTPGTQPGGDLNRVCVKDPHPFAEGGVLPGSLRVDALTYDPRLGEDREEPDQPDQEEVLDVVGYATSVELARQNLVKAQRNYDDTVAAQHVARATLTGAEENFRNAVVQASEAHQALLDTYGLLPEDRPKDAYGLGLR